MNIQAIFKTALAWSKTNSPLVLTAVAVGGVVSTAILAVKAGEDTSAAYEDDFEDIGPITRSEYTKRYWHHYIPPAISVGFTIAAIIAAHKINVRRQATVAAALAISEKGLLDYREKVTELFGREKSERVMTELVKDKVESGKEIVDERPPWDKEERLLAPGDQLFIETWGGRAFVASENFVHGAVNHLNRHIVNHMYASLNEFYGALSLGDVDSGDKVGWNVDNFLEIEPLTEAIVTADGRSAILLKFHNHPRSDYMRLL